MRIRRCATAIVAIAALGFGAAALGHTSLSSVSPPDGAVLESSPEVIEITFGEAAHLTSVVVVAADKKERPLAFLPKGSAVTFKVAAPQLAPGRNEIRWKALSKDGHVIGGKFTLTVK